MNGFLLGISNPEEATVLVAFIAAILLIDSFDISLPRGDSIGMSGPLVAASVVAFGPWVAMAIGLGSAAAIQLARRMRGLDAALLDEIAVRAASIGLASAASMALTFLGIEVVIVVAVPAVYLATELVGRQVLLALRGGRSLRRLLAGNISRQALLFAAQLSVSALTILTYQSMGVWSVIPVVALLLLMRQAYSMLLEIRETYLTTVSVLVEAAESQSESNRGHSERTASIARAIGSHCGLSTNEIERLSYAALLHDIGRIADIGEDGRPAGSASLVADVAFFDHILEVLRILDGADAEPGGRNDRDLLASFIVALSSDIDDTSSREDGQASFEPAVSRIAPLVPSRMKAQTVAAAVGLGYPVPAID